MKHAWRKEEKEIYLPKAVPTLVDIPEYSYFVIHGEGNPNDKDFAKKVEMLYALSYAIRMMPKNGFTPEGYEEYTVYPLEGIWDLTEEGRSLDTLDKDELVYDIMIRQPDFVTAEVVKKAFEIVKSKKKDMADLHKVSFVKRAEGKCLQILHIGPYDTEPESFQKMKDYMKANQLEQRTLVHKEIYLSDPRKADPEKMKTVLRYFLS